MLFESCLTLLLVVSTRCSLVVDSHGQKGIYLSDYCPKMEHCPEGAHIMCMYYNPNSPVGPRCRNARNVTMTPELANKLLDVANAVRSKLARGKEKGKNGELFPRAYGIFRLKWDTELATFAQVLANQCMLRHDLCRATKKFPDPGQTVGLVRFSIPDWIPVSKSGNFTYSGLNNEKMMYAATQALKSWYGQKSSVTVQMLTNYPDWTQNPNQQGGRLYMEMIYGSSTHMGCGISAYTEYAYYDNNASLHYNSIQIICNFSARPRKGFPVFNTVPPGDTSSTFNQCGCPAGSIEDDDCLCHEVPPEEPDPPVNVVRKSQSCPNGDCDPTVVLLPIFTVEDAPPEKLIPQNSSVNNVGRVGHPEADSFEELIDNNISKKSYQDPQLRKAQTQLHQKRIGQNPRSKKRKNVSIRNRHFNSKHQQEHEPRQFRKNNPISHRSSIFSKTPRFELPGSQFMTTIKRDVVPRKDFSTGKKLASKLYEQKIMSVSTNNHKSTDRNEVKSVEFPNLGHHDLRNDYVHFDDIFTTETILNTAEQKIMNHKKHINEITSEKHHKNQINKHDKHDVQQSIEDSDSKLMALLDTLEQEVKHIEWRDKEKELFDAKIKKIYGKIVGKSDVTLNKFKTTTPKDISAELNERLKDLKDSKEHNAISNTDNDNLIDDDNSVRKLEPPHDDEDGVRKLEPPHDNIKNTIKPGPRKHLRDITDTELDSFDKYPKQEIDDNDLGIMPKIMSKSYKAQSKYDKRDKSYMQRFKNTDRHRNNNDLDSFEMKDRIDGFSGRKSYRTMSFDKKINDIDKPFYRINASKRRFRNKNYGNEGWTDDLSAERRKFYQEKLDEMERKLQDVKRYSRRKSPSNRPRHLRAMRPSGRDNQVDSLYNPGRARFLHGY